MAQTAGSPERAPRAADTAAAAERADEGPRVAAGRIVRPTRDDVVPVPGVWVTLHRVGSDTAGPMDSTRTGPDGRYVFHYRHTGRADAVYFASVSYDGVTYFSLPFGRPRVVGDSAEVTVYDTTSGPLTLHVRGRHLIVSTPHADGSRDVFEVYEISNDSSVTLVSPDDAHPTWSTVIPGDATQFEVGQSEISPRAIRQEVGRVMAVAPFAPGLKQLSFGYRLPAKAFPLSVPLERDVTVLEVLLEEPAAHVEGAGLTAVAPVAIEGRRFNRFLAQDVKANAVFTVDTPPTIVSGGNTRFFSAVAIGIALVMTAALTLVFLKRRRPLAPAAATVAGPPVPPTGSTAAQLARAIADLDAAFERRANPSAEERAAYEERRSDLKRELARALDAERQHV
jgi:hypothetical protein